MMDISHDGYFSTDAQATPLMMVVLTRAIMAELMMAAKEMGCLWRPSWYGWWNGDNGGGTGGMTMMVVGGVMWQWRVDDLCSSDQKMRVIAKKGNRGDNVTRANSSCKQK